MNIVDIRNMKSRLIIFGVPVMGGAVYHALSEMHGGSLPHAVVPAIFTLFTEMAMHLWTHDVHEAIREPRENARDILENEHLNRIVGVTVAALIDEAATDTHYSAADRQRLEAIARFIEEHWQEVPVRDPADFAGVSSFKLPEFLSGDADNFLKVPALTPEIWQSFLQSDQWWDGKRYFSGVELDPQTVRGVAAKLHTEFAQALFDALAVDCARHGEAYSKMVLLMLGELRSSNRQISLLARQIFEMASETKATTGQTLTDTGDLLIKVDEILALLRKHQAEQTPANRFLIADRHDDALHQKYLARVIDTVGRLTLANIDPAGSNADGAPLEEIYVDLPTECALRTEVKSGRVTKWWVSRGDQGAGRVADFFVEDRPVDARQENHTGSQALQCDDEEGLQALVAEAEKSYLERRARAEEAKAQDKSYYNDIKDGVYTAAPSLSAAYLVGAYRRLVVLGAPGSGKSTLVRHLALCLAGEQRKPWTRPAALSRLPGWPHGALTPIYIELRRFVGSAFFPDLDNKPVVEDLWNYIEAEIVGAALKEYAPQLKQRLIDGRAVVILDGLDEVPYPAGEGNLARRQQQIRALAQVIDDHYGASRIVVTSRPYAYNNWELDGYTPIHIAPFADSQRIALAANLYRLSRYQQPDEKARRLNTALKQQGISSELADNPLFLTLMATLFARSESGEGLPSRKGALYHASVLLLLERWTEAKAGNRKLKEMLGSLNRDDLLARLAGLAYKVHTKHGVESNGATPEIPEEWLYTDLFKMERKDPGVKAVGLLYYLSENTGLLESPGHKGDDYVFRFSHRTFQEYLAAKHLVDVECKGDYRPVRELIASQPDLWRTPCLLVGDVLRDSLDGRPYDKLWKLVWILLGGKPENAVPNPRWWPICLAAGIAEEQCLYEQTDLDPGDQLVRDCLVGWLVNLLATAGSLPAQERARCGRVLSLLSDPRPGTGLRSEGVPEIVWGEAVLPGKYPVGGDEEAWRSLPATEVALDYEYRLAKHPVTNVQFQAFVNADSEGYNNPAYWTPSGLEWKGARRGPEEAGESTFGLANHPRVNVTWYEALAFCRWLSARYRKLGLLDQSEEISLPTQIEWEICARGAAGRLFPYGNDFDAARANVADSKIGATSAVGIFPDGASPYGVLDMSGNVWEWCMTAIESGSNDASGNAARVLRGGAWNGSDDDARACARNSFGAYVSWVGVVGFRVACLPHSAKRF